MRLSVCRVMSSVVLLLGVAVLPACSSGGGGTTGLGPSSSVPETVPEVGWPHLDVDELHDDLEAHLTAYLDELVPGLEAPRCEGAEGALGDGWSVESDLGDDESWCVGRSDGDRALIVINPHRRPILVSTPEGSNRVGRSEHDLAVLFPDTAVAEGWTILLGGQEAAWSLDVEPGRTALFLITSGGPAEMVAAVDAASEWLAGFAVDLPDRPGLTRTDLIGGIGASGCLESFLRDADPERPVEPGELTRVLRNCLGDDIIGSWAGDDHVAAFGPLVSVILDGDTFAEGWRAGSRQPVGGEGRGISVSVENLAPPNTPEGVAQAFLDAVVAGDAGAAQALTTGDVDPTAYEWARRAYEEVGSAELWGPAGCFTMEETMCSWFRSDPSSNLVMVERGGRWLVSHPVSPLSDQLGFMENPEHHLMCVEDTTPLNLRGGPGTDWPAFAQLAIDRCGLLGYPIVETAPNGGVWRLIGVPGEGIGWVFDDHLRLES